MMGSGGKVGASMRVTYDPKTDTLLNIGDAPKAQPAPFKAALDFLEEWAVAQRK